LAALSPDTVILQITRYQPFTAHLRSLIENGTRFQQIAGNELGAFFSAAADWPSVLNQLGMTDMVVDS